jgi:hypothetical protein
MRRGRLRLEGHRDIECPSLEQVGDAIRKMASPTGPTWVLFEDDSGSYIQAAGSGGRYVVESRDVYGEGFRHWRASKSSDAGAETTTILFRNKCPRGKHSPRGCPLTISATQVVGLDDVSQTISHYAVTDERHPAYSWHDVSAEHMGNTLPYEIKKIVARSRND